MKHLNIVKAAAIVEIIKKAEEIPSSTIKSLPSPNKLKTAPTANVSQPEIVNEITAPSPNAELSNPSDTAPATLDPVIPHNNKTANPPQPDEEYLREVLGNYNKNSIADKRKVQAIQEAWARNGAPLTVQQVYADAGFRLAASRK